MTHSMLPVSHVRVGWVLVLGSQLGRKPGDGSGEGGSLFSKSIVRFCGLRVLPDPGVIRSSVLTE